MKIRRYEPLDELWTVQNRLSVGRTAWTSSDRQLSGVAAERSALRQALSQQQAEADNKSGERRSAWRRARSAVTKTA